jgi:hypothetical protein
MMNIFKKYRVLEIDGKFIPQYKVAFEWEGIDKVSYFLWYLYSHQEEYCSFDNLEDAKAHIEKHKKRIGKPKIKHHY